MVVTLYGPAVTPVGKWIVNALMLPAGLVSWLLWRRQHSELVAYLLVGAIANLVFYATLIWLLTGAWQRRTSRKLP